jgi:hypothetical protein
MYQFPVSLALNMTGVLCIFSGTIVLEGDRIRRAISWSYMQARQNTGRLRWYHKVLGRLFWINSENWFKVYVTEFDLNKKDAERFHDPNGWLRGILWIGMGTFFLLLGQII